MENKERSVYVIDCRTADGKRKRMAIYADDIDECSSIFRKHEGEKAVMKSYIRMTEWEYKNVL